MADNVFLKSLLAESRKRLVGSLMSYLEQNVYPKLNKQQQDELRTKVLTSVGAYHDACLDMLKASINDGSISNEYLLEEIRDGFDEILKAL